MTAKEKKAVYMKQYRLDNKESITVTSKQWRLDNKEKKAESNKQWRLDNPEYSKEYNRIYNIVNKKRLAEYNKRRYDDPSTGVKKRNSENNRKRYQEDPSYRKQQQNVRLKFKYGITMDEKNKMILDQDNKCARCGLPFEGEHKEKNGPAVDHDHSFEKGDSNSVRAILHNKCNIQLGYHENKEEYQLSMDYLEKYGIKNDL